MSSRAIRKLQKLREQELQQSSLGAEKDNDDSSEDEMVTRPSKPKFNAFDLLNTAEEEDDDDDEEAGVQETVTLQPEPRSPTATPTEPSKKKKKKKKKKKANASGKFLPANSDDAELDEIDRALQELATDGRSSQAAAQSTAATVSEREDYPMSLEELLSVEPKFLNAMNEMRKLFGNVVLENFDQPQNEGTGRRRERNRETVDLGQALTGRYSPASRGQSLAGVTLRRNFLMQGKGEWPRAPSGGLGMEVVESLASGTTVYRILHNAAYQDVQRQFELCVESMDPQRLIHLLQYNPYHISTLLQVSDIAKHQGDHAVSADLLERALFNVGRSAHSSFGTQLKAGRAKLSFTHMENRELWLVGWRYIANLGMKGTWRTAYEWAKLLLSLDELDPYSISLLIDHLALRGREYTHFIDLCTKTSMKDTWSGLPNIQCSLALAYLRQDKRKECRDQLRLALARWPWVFCKIAQELEISPMPKAIWGRMPPNPSHELLMELYVARAKDLWNTPEAKSLIVEVANTVPENDETASDVAPEITLNIARHVILSDIPRVTTHLPSHFTSGRISASDPLPPYDSQAFQQQSDPTPAYISRIPEMGRPQWLRDLLDQLNNGALHFPRHEAQPTDGEEEIDVPADGYHTEENDDQPVGRAPLPLGDHEEGVLEEWLIGDGLIGVQEFLQQYGVDRGNWGEVVDFAPLLDYVEGLGTLPVSTRHGLIHGPIHDVLGDMGVEILEEELQNYDDSMDG
ncbi:hypothetical protein ASPZODRAFT_130994 [Penicilliopsis zonata CBS 506.65]|uniref:Ribosome quality control complex subunit 1 n=1 Tax=Penicilliopsis zonata CBS 506.65 TaxID=1073090 RepID=A0A1L9SK75_9EURO|nr:hypothetical protein ASPZODRAFT_130994 [Penicilliopsis zonata CBS 506.65]OJJ47496.1 hypothetical protein ASPZODRAFT_130994 [Penicilliopsis zonata CBS 506.65]